MKEDDAAGADRHFFPRVKVAPGPFALLAHFEGSESVDAHGLPLDETIGDHVEETVHERFALAQREILEFSREMLHQVGSGDVAVVFRNEGRGHVSKRKKETARPRGGGWS